MMIDEQTPITRRNYYVHTRSRAELIAECNAFEFMHSCLPSEYDLQYMTEALLIEIRVGFDMKDEILEMYLGSYMYHCDKPNEACNNALRACTTIKEVLDKYDTKINYSLNIKNQELRNHFINEFKNRVLHLQARLQKIDDNSFDFKKQRLYGTKTK